MKKVKIMLTAIAVFAVVGGALAFKSKTAFFHLYQCNTSDRCVDVDPTNTYKIDNTNGTSKVNATVTDTAPGAVSCSTGKCTATISVSVEPIVP